MSDITFGTDREVLGTAAGWVHCGWHTALVTVVKTWGSSPRPVGSLLVMRSDGRFEGSVSGGCIEDDLISRFVENEITEQLPAIIDYGVKVDDAARFGLPCGGRLELLIEILHDEAQLNQLLMFLDEGNIVRREVRMDTGEIALHSAGPDDDFSSDVHRVNQIFGPSWRLLLVGAGQLARYTSRIAMMAGYRVSVCEPREEHRIDWHEDGVELLTCMPDEAVMEIANHPRAAVITLAHDPKVDDMALMEALKSKAFYVGALGSKKTSTSRRQRLSQLELDKTQIDKLHAPVGLDIGSRTPPEIALSIIAGITAKRRLAAR